jgi:hypothetical protein
MTSLLLRCNMTGLHMTEPFGQFGKYARTHPLSIVTEPFGH